jgi:hypothetical protein
LPGLEAHFAIFSVFLPLRGLMRASRPFMADAVRKPGRQGAGVGGWVSLRQAGGAPAGRVRSPIKADQRVNLRNNWRPAAASVLPL